MKALKKIKKLVIPASLILLTACDGGGGGGAPAGETRVAVVEVGSVVDARFSGEGWNLDGAQMVGTVAKLLEPANFSATTGTVATSINITSTAATQGDINAALLSDFDIFFIGWLNDGAAAFTTAELTAIQNWVTGGGILIATCDDIDHDAVCESLGYVPTPSSTNPTVASVAGSAHDIFNGTFGAVTSIEMTGILSYFPITTNATVLGEDSAATPNATIMEKQYGTGTVIFLADIDMISNYGALSSGTGIVNDNDRFLGNLFEYATGLVSDSATPTAASTGEALYVSQCQSCHGVNGTGGSNSAVVGASTASIIFYIDVIASMNGLATDAEAALISEFLTP